MVSLKPLDVIIIIGLFSIMCVAQESIVYKKIIDLAKNINSSFLTIKTNQDENQIAVSEFSSIGNTAEKKNIGKLVTEVLTGELSKYNTFTLIERENLKKILDEQALALSGLIDSETSSEIGELLGAKAIISGSVLEAGSFFIVNARMVSVASGKVILTESVEIPQSDLIALSNRLVVTKKYALDAVYRSVLLPGWGQIYNDNPKRGYFYLGTSIISLGATVAFKLQGDKDFQNYQDATWGAAQYYDQAVNNYLNRDYALYTLAGIWAVNVLDAWITAHRQLRSNSSSFPDNSIRFSTIPQAGGFQMYLSWSF